MATTSTRVLSSAYRSEWEISSDVASGSVELDITDSREILANLDISAAATVDFQAKATSSANETAGSLLSESLTVSSSERFEGEYARFIATWSGNTGTVLIDITATKLWH